MSTARAGDMNYFSTGNYYWPTPQPYYTQPGICPHCGRCPQCGQGGFHMHPWITWGVDNATGEDNTVSIPTVFTVDD